MSDCLLAASQSRLRGKNELAVEASPLCTYMGNEGTWSGRPCTDRAGVPGFDKIIVFEVGEIEKALLTSQSTLDHFALASSSPPAMALHASSVLPEEGSSLLYAMGPSSTQRRLEL